MPTAAVEQLIAQAMQNYRAGRLNEAEGLFHQILLINPDDSNAMNLLGVIRAQANDYPAALELISRALAIHANNASYHLNLGRVLVRMDRVDEAIASLQRARALNPQNANILTNLGTALRTAGQLDEAENCFRKVLALRSNDPEDHCNLGVTLLAQNRTDEAIASYHSSLAIKPDFAGAYNNLGNALMLKRDVHQAIAFFRRAIELAPDVAMVHHNLSLALLLAGDFENGWREYEWRAQAKELKLDLDPLPQPVWDGGELNGRLIYLRPEQGLGDFIQFARYVPMVAQRGGRIILGCFEQLADLVRCIPGVEQFVRYGQAIPNFDIYCPLASLPQRFNTTLETIPADIPYIHADPQLSQQWKTRVQAIDAKLKIGLVWAGRPDHKNDHNRSMRLYNLAPLAQLSDAVFFSLQKGEAANQTSSPPPGMKIIDWASEFRTLSDTAALIDNLDLVIAVDTSVAHLAGAMGKPVRVLLPFNGEWRWLLDRNDSPWYPTMKLFRQSTPGDWEAPLSQIIQSIRASKAG